MKPTTTYIRTSTTEQTPEIQIKDCEKVRSRLQIPEDDIEIISEKESAWKDSVFRPEFEKIKKGIERREIKNLIVWDLDRLFRNRKRLIEFFEFCKHYNCKIYSYRQDWLESINKIPSPFNEMMSGFMIQIMGWMGEDESNKKSQRVKNAVVRIEGEKTKSYKGNIWGRKSIVTNKNIIRSVQELYSEGKSIRDISRQVYYWDKNHNQRKLSVGAVHKIISRFSLKNEHVKEDVQTLNNK